MLLFTSTGRFIRYAQISLAASVTAALYVGPRGPPERLARPEKLEHADGIRMFEIGATGEARVEPDMTLGGRVWAFGSSK